jgi:hypothetical protein
VIHHGKHEGFVLDFTKLSAYQLGCDASDDPRYPKRLCAKNRIRVD